MMTEMNNDNRQKRKKGYYMFIVFNGVVFYGGSALGISRAFVSLYILCLALLVIFAGNKMRA